MEKWIDDPKEVKKGAEKATCSK